MTDQELDQQALATLKHLQRARAEHAAHTARLREHEERLVAIFGGGTLVQPGRGFHHMGFSWDAARGVLTMYHGGVRRRVAERRGCRRDREDSGCHICRNRPSQGSPEGHGRRSRTVQVAISSVKPSVSGPAAARRVGRLRPPPVGRRLVRFLDLAGRDLHDVGSAGDRIGRAPFALRASRHGCTSLPPASLAAFCSWISFHLSVYDPVPTREAGWGSRPLKTYVARRGRRSCVRMRAGSTET